MGTVVKSKERVSRRTMMKGAAGAGATGLAVGVGTRMNGGGEVKASALQSSVEEIAEARGLTPDDITAALKTYVPSGVHDDFLIFSSGGQSGQVLVIGVPSMRLLKVIAVFAPEPWQGFGFSNDTWDVLAGGEVDGKVLTCGDTHHPGLSETEGQYDGQFLFINDKANARIGVIDLRDFETKQIVKNPHIISNHGGTFVTPNTEYIIDGSQYAAPHAWQYAPIENYADEYRGAMTFWKFDRDAGRIAQDQSFSVELPPYWNDLADAGKGPSMGWMFSNTFNTELSYGSGGGDAPPVEVGASQRDMDYLTVINWEKAAEVVAAGRAEEVNGMPMIPMGVAVEEGLLWFVPEPKSPHGADVTPDGKYIVVSGKLDPHVTIYSFEKIQQAIADGKYEPDAYGVPVLDFEACMEAQVELGLGPLHTQFDDQGLAYTSLFLDSGIARWKVGGEGVDDGWKLIDMIPMQFNTGHICVAEGDTVSPAGQYLIGMNKWALDRFHPVGPLLPQNFQLVDITGDQMQLLYDMPIGIGEPHYVQMIKSERLENIWEVYPEVGWDTINQAPSEFATQIGQERIERDGENVTIYMTTIRSTIRPDYIELQKGDKVTLHLTNVELAHDATHGFTMPGQDINLSIEPGETTTVSWVADTAGTYPYYCTEFCSALHLEMMGYLLVTP
ncbi:MAG: Sec-dependent nitrous-oxide reductase [Thermomicrobiales bacterium]|nr:Sec-dependent nitrous-oxide reductase [Thermomicrobiales bacterium]